VGGGERTLVASLTEKRETISLNARWDGRGKKRKNSKGEQSKFEGKQKASWGRRKKKGEKTLFERPLAPQEKNQKKKRAVMKMYLAPEPPCGKRRNLWSQQGRMPIKGGRKGALSKTTAPKGVGGNRAEQ